MAIALAFGASISDASLNNGSELVARSSVSTPATDSLVLTYKPEIDRVPAASANKTVSMAKNEVANVAASIPLGGTVPEPNTLSYVTVGMVATLFGAFRRQRK